MPRTSKLAAIPQDINELHTQTTVTRADLAEAVYQQMGLSRIESANLVTMVLEEICSSLVERRTVKLSSFGTFMVRKRSKRVGRNPKTGETVPIKSRNVMFFKPSNNLKLRVNGVSCDKNDG